LYTLLSFRHQYFSHFSRYPREFISYIWRFTRTHYFEFDPKSRRRTKRRRNAENSRSGLSSRRLVSSRRYLSSERTAGRRSRASPSPPGDFVFTFLAFASLRRRLRFPYPSRVTRGATTRKWGASRIAKTTKLPLRRQVRGRPGQCSKSHYPHIIVFNSFSRRIISRRLARPSIRFFLLLPSRRAVERL